MISGLDLNIYQALFQLKKLTEKYIGKVKFDWEYSEIHYTAECTVGIPFDLFDKTIVGILLVDEVLSIEEIGDILGMNVIHSPENQQYRDDAEFDILRMALDNLYQYKMIEIGDTSYSSCRLTNIGKEYAQKGRKFKIENNKPFTLVYDHTSQNHTDAKALFKNLKGKNQTSIISDFDFLNEPLMKKMATKQAVQVYDEQKGNSFTNPKIDSNKSQSFSLEIFTAVLYDLESNQTRLLAYEPTTKTIDEYFSKWLNENRLEEIIGSFQNQNLTEYPLNLLPNSYIQKVVQEQKDFENEVIANPEKAFSITKQVNQDSDFIDIEYFWNNLENFVAVDTKECWFFIPEPNGKILSLIEKLAENCQDIIVFVSINATNDEELGGKIKKLTNKASIHDNNLFVIQVAFREIQKFKFWQTGDSFVEYNEASISIRNGYCFNTLVKTQLDVTRNYKLRKYYFAKEILPLLYKSLFQVASEEVENINKAKILSFFNLDKKSRIFIDLKEHEDVLQQIFQIEKLKNNFIFELKNRHQVQLRSELKQILVTFEKQDFSKLEHFKKIQEIVEVVDNELFEDYTDLQKEITDIENKIHAKEKRIKDEILAKTYIIDTNVFIEEPEIISKIDSKHYIALTLTVIEELDKLKMREKTKEKASKAIKNINEALQQANKQKRPRVRKARANLSLLPEELQQKSGDNYLLSMAMVYQDQNPIILTIDKNLQSKAMMIEVPIISLKEFSGEKPEPNMISIKANDIDYKEIFNQIQPNKNGKYQISSFITILKKENTEFNYKDLGFEKAWQFVESLGIFEITENQFLNLK